MISRTAVLFHRCAMDRVWLLLLLWPLAAQPVRAAEFTPDAIDAAVEQLGANQFSAREEASAFLWRAGESARTALQQATRSRDREVASRAKDLIEKLDLGILPDTSPAIASLLRAYRNADEQRREQILDQLREQQSFESLLRVLRNEPNEAIRSRQLERLISDRNTLIPLLIQGSFDEMEKLMQFAALSPEHHATCAAYISLRGRLDQRVAELQRATSDAERLLLARLMRLQQQPAKALEVVLQVPYADERTEDHFWRRMLEAELLQATGDWAAMAKIVDHANVKGIDCENDVERLGQSAFFHRMAGNEAKLLQRADELKKLAVAKPEESWHCMEALLVNDLLDEAVEICGQYSDTLLLDLLVRLGRYQEALDQAGWSDPAPSMHEWFSRRLGNPTDAEGHIAASHRAIRVASILMRLGRADEGRSLFAEVARRSAEKTPVMATLVATERRLRLPDWKQHAVTALDFAAATNRDPDRYPFTEIVGDSSGVFWRALREQFPDDSVVATLERVDRLASPRFGRLPFDGEQRAVVEYAFSWVKTQDENARHRYFHALAEFCQKRNERELARRCYEETIAIRPMDLVWQKLGDIAASESRWQDALKAYENEWERSRKPLPLYLRGTMLERLRRRDEAIKAMELARLLPLGEEDDRATLADGLQSRGLTEEAHRQWQFVLNSGTLWDHSMGQAFQSAGNAVAKTDPFAAAVYWERFRSTVLSTESAFLEVGDHLELARTIHRVRARGYFLQKQFDLALGEAQRSIDADPEDVDSVLGLMQLFTEGEHPELAQRLFDRFDVSYREKIAAYPESAYFHNGRAWLLIKSNRALDEALAHARRAVALSPEDPAPIDTLALILHQRGEHAEAISLARRCIELLPGETHFRQQLAEFEKAVESK